MSTLLTYEPHDNLCVNMKTADECRNLSELRYEIDTIDHFIIKLIRHRMDFALATLKFKLDGKPIPDNERIIQQLSKRKEWAEKYGLDPKFIESFFKSMIDWYMSQQISHYKTQHLNEATIQFKLCSLAELKAIEFGLTWIDVLHYGQLLSSGYRKARELAKPVLVSYTQKTSIFSDNLHLSGVHPFSLFEQSHRLSLPYAFLFAQPAQQFFLLALGIAQQFDVNQDTLHINSMDKKITDLTVQEYHSEVKEVVDGGWKRLLVNAIIEDPIGTNFSSYGPVLTGGLCFDHQNTYRSQKWSRFSDTSFVLPKIQFNHERGITYMTFNTVITDGGKLEQEVQLIDSQIISLLELCHKLLNGEKKYADDIPNPSLDHNHHNQLIQTSVLSSDNWKHIVRDAIMNINNGDFEKVMLACEIKIETDLQKISDNIGGSFTHLSSLYPSSCLFGILRQGSCVFGVTSAPFVRLLENQIEVAAPANTTIKGKNENQNKTSETKVLNTSTQQQRGYCSMIDFIKNRLQSITESNSLVVLDKPTPSYRAYPQHLYQSVVGTIRRETTLLDLVQTLHPTPAVSGFPQLNALNFIREKEDLDRGWFVSPIGWIGAHNNGEFVVTSLSALMNEDSVSLFADCDIVADSDPEDKLQEAMFKITTMLFALTNK